MRNKHTYWRQPLIRDSLGFNLKSPPVHIFPGDHIKSQVSKGSLMNAVPWQRHRGLAGWFPPPFSHAPYNTGMDLPAWHKPSFTTSKELCRHPPFVPSLLGEVSPHCSPPSPPDTSGCFYWRHGSTQPCHTGIAVARLWLGAALITQPVLAASPP